MSTLYKRGRIWWLAYQDEYGKRQMKSLRTGHKGKAEAMAQFIEKRVRQADRQPRKELDALKDQYLAGVQAAHSHQHYCDMKQRVSTFIREAHIARPDQITLQAVQGFLTGLKGRNAINTIRGYKVAISGFCEFLKNGYYLPDNPCRGGRLQMPKTEMLPPRFLTDEQYEQTLAAARDAGIYPQVLTALSTGMRSAEIRRLCWEDIDFERRSITVKRAKSKRYRTIPLTQRLVEVLEPMRRASGPVFRGQRGGMVGEKQWRELLAPIQKAVPAFKAGHRGTGTAWHMLRHTFATRYVMAGGDIYRLSKILGHSNIQTTQRYAHLVVHQDAVMERI